GCCSPRRPWSTVGSSACRRSSAASQPPTPRAGWPRSSSGAARSPSATSRCSRCAASGSSTSAMPPTDPAEPGTTPPPKTSGDEPVSSEPSAARLTKLRALEAGGQTGYALRFDRTHTASDIAGKHQGLDPGTETGEQVRVAGRVMTVRRHGKVAFADLADQTGRIQLFAQADRLGDRLDDFAELDIGDWVGAWGEVVTTRRGELSVRIDGFELLTKSLRPWPEKWHGLTNVERRYRQRYVDLATNARAREIFAARSTLVAEMRSWLVARGFVEVETPML